MTLFQERKTKTDYKLTAEELNGMTKFPSIYPLHEFIRVGKKMLAHGEPIHSIKDKEFDITEKIDGTNIRIIIHRNCNEVFIGGRGELLAYNKDLLYNDKYGVIDIINKTFDEKILDSFHKSSFWDGNEFLILYGELFGKGIQKRGKQYNAEGRDFRLFAVRSLTIETINVFKSISRENWHSVRRKNTSMRFFPFGDVLEIRDKLGLQTVPYHGTINIDDLATPEEVSNFIKDFTNSSINNARSEGIVLHSLDSSDYDHAEHGTNFASFKLKFENYR